MNLTAYGDRRKLTGKLNPPLNPRATPPPAIHTTTTFVPSPYLFKLFKKPCCHRFSDFRWLHSCFRAIPGVLAPPLPPSKWAGSSSRDFVVERMKGLQRYMARVGQHPILSRHYAFQVGFCFWQY